VGVLSLLVNRSQAYAVLLHVDAKIKGRGFVVLISKGETFISESATVSVVLKKKFNLNNFHPSVPYLHMYRNTVAKCLLHVKC